MKASVAAPFALALALGSAAGARAAVTPAGAKPNYAPPATLRELVQLPPAATVVQRYHDKIAFLSKRAGNPFPNMVSVGRALNNDVVIVLSTISKLHGYFLCEGSSWSFIDHRSRNGTRVNDLVVAPNERKPLADGDRSHSGSRCRPCSSRPRRSLTS